MYYNRLLETVYLGEDGDIVEIDESHFKRHGNVGHIPRS